MVPPFATAVAARLTGEPGTTVLLLIGVSRVTVGGEPIGDTTSSGSCTSRAAPALSVARADRTKLRDNSPGSRAGAEYRKVYGAVVSSPILVPSIKNSTRTMARPIDGVTVATKLRTAPLGKVVLGVVWPAMT